MSGELPLDRPSVARVVTLVIEALDRAEKEGIRDVDQWAGVLTVDCMGRLALGEVVGLTEPQIHGIEKVALRWLVEVRADLKRNPPGPSWLTR